MWHSPKCLSVQKRAVLCRYRNCPSPTFVVNFFMVGPDRVTWELTSVDKPGVCRLAISHAGGVIVEYFTSTAAALQREEEIESLFTGRAQAGRNDDFGRSSHWPPSDRR
jgi:hypothetical protein